MMNGVRGQSGAGTVRGRAVAPYRQAPRDDPASETDTYVAPTLTIHNWRWAGVPFYSSPARKRGVAGKSLQERVDRGGPRRLNNKQEPNNVVRPNKYRWCQNYY